MLPTIVIVGYNRIDSLTRLLISVKNADYPKGSIRLVVSLDYSPFQEEIACTIEKLGWDRGDFIIRKFSEKQGLKKHVISCGNYVRQYDSIILLEDDLLVSPNYYNYVVQMENHFSGDDRICGYSLYRHSWNGYGNYEFLPQKNEYDVFLGKIGVSWGQAWNKKQWESFINWYEDNMDKDYLGDDIPFSINNWGEQSWAKYYYKYMVEKNKYYVFPYTSLSTNFSEIGEHNEGRPSLTYQVMLLETKKMHYRVPSFEKAIKYDMYFERILEKKDDVLGIPGDEICVNLNGYKTSTENKKYLLTCKRYNNKKYIASFGIRMRPIEQNIFKNISGEDIFLYKVSEIIDDEIQNYRRTSERRIEYELYGNPIQRLEYYCNTVLETQLIKKCKNIDRLFFDASKHYSITQKCLTRFINENNNDGSVWMFHQVYPSYSQFIDYEYAIKAELFERLIKIFLDSGYSFKSINELKCGDSERNIYLTFDDAYKGVFEYVYPICRKYSIPFAVFVTCNYLDREEYMTQTDVRELSQCKLCTIGSHTCNHSYLRALNRTNKEYEIRESKKQIEKIIGKDVEFFAYPYGSVQAVDSESIKIVEEAGYKMAFSTIQAHISNSLYETIKYYIPRKNVNDEIANEMIQNELHN